MCHTVGPKATLRILRRANNSRCASWYSPHHVVPRRRAKASHHRRSNVRSDLPAMPSSPLRREALQARSLSEMCRPEAGLARGASQARGPGWAGTCLPYKQGCGANPTQLCALAESSNALLLLACHTRRRCPAPRPCCWLRVSISAVRRNGSFTGCRDEAGDTQGGGGGEVEA